MKYLSVNKLKNFNFHDAEMKFISYEEDNLKLETKYLNIHKITEQNNTNKDMEIFLAEITFKKFNILYFKNVPAINTGELEFVLKGKDAKDKLIEELKKA